MPAAPDDTLAAHSMRARARTVRDAATALLVRVEGVLWQSPVFADHVRDEANRTASALHAIADRLDAAAIAAQQKVHAA